MDDLGVPLFQETTKSASELYGPTILHYTPYE